MILEVSVRSAEWIWSKLVKNKTPVSKKIIVLFFCCWTFLLLGNSDSLKNSCQDPLALLCKYLKMPCLSGNESPAGKYILNVCQQSGFHTRLFTDADTAFNFSASLYPLDSKKPNVIFLNHIDVVPANDSVQWQHSPYGGIVLNDTVYGRGCIDMKGIAVMQLIAAYQFKEENKEKIGRAHV